MSIYYKYYRWSLHFRSCHIGFHKTQVRIQAGMQGEREREREREKRKYAYQESTTADPLERFLLSFFLIFQQSLGSHEHVQWAVNTRRLPPPT